MSLHLTGPAILPIGRTPSTIAPSVNRGPLLHLASFGLPAVDGEEAAPLPWAQSLERIARAAER